MTSLFVIVEGHTEQEFVKRVLAPHLESRQIWATPIEVTTKRDPKTGQKLARGGGQWRQWHKEIRSVLRSSEPGLRVTSLFDLYGLPADFPTLEASKSERDTILRADSLQKAMAEEINDRRFLPYVQRHEFEALVLSGLEHLSKQLTDADARAGLEVLRRELGEQEPEEVNDGKETAPSKRLLNRVPGYNKTTHGPLVTLAVGIDGLKRKCPRFREWVETLESWTAPRTTT